jgi:hypothetical protein
MLMPMKYLFHYILSDCESICAGFGVRLSTPREVQLQLSCQAASFMAQQASSYAKGNIHNAEIHAVDKRKFLTHKQHIALSTAMQLSTPVEIRSNLKNASPEPRRNELMLQNCHPFGKPYANFVPT